MLRQTDVLQSHTVETGAQEIAAIILVTARDLIINSVIRDASEPLYHVECIARAYEETLRGEVGGVNDQRLAFPVTA